MNISLASKLFYITTMLIFISRFHEEDMEYEEFADECRDMTLWMNEVEVALAQRDPSPADKDGLDNQLEKIKVSDKI